MHIKNLLLWMSLNMCANVTVLNVFHVDIFIKTQAETKKLHRRGDTWHCINY